MHTVQIVKPPETDCDLFYRAEKKIDILKIYIIFLLTPVGVLKKRYFFSVSCIVTPSAISFCRKGLLHTVTSNPDVCLHLLVLTMNYLDVSLS